MAADSETAGPPGFRFGTAVSVALRAVFGRPGRFLKLALIPFCLALALSVAKIPAAAWLPESDLAFLVLDLIPYTLVAIAVSRIILLEEDAGFLPQPAFGRRTWVYLGYSLLMLVATVIAVALLVAVGIGATALIGGGAEEFDPSNWLIAVLVAAGLAFVYAVARLSLVFPAVAADHKLGLRGSWRLARGSSLKLFALLILLTVLMILLAALGSLVTGSGISVNIGGGAEIIPGATLGETLAANAAAIVWGNMVSLVSTAVMNAAFASAFAQLSGWGRPRAELLETFE